MLDSIYDNLEMMSKKALVIILVLSVVVTYGIALVDVLFNQSILAGESGVPLRFDSSSLFGGGSTNYLNLLLDIIFWFLVVLAIWKLLQKVFSKK